MGHVLPSDKSKLTTFISTGDEESGVRAYNWTPKAIGVLGRVM